MNHVKIKQEDMSDKFGLLRRVETILHNLYESRSIFVLWDQTEGDNTMQQVEKKILADTVKDLKAIETEKRNEAEAKLRIERTEKIKQRINRPQIVGRRDNVRSEKEKLKGGKKKSVYVPKEVKDMRRFLAVVTDDYPEHMMENQMQ